MVNMIVIFHVFTSPPDPCFTSLTAVDPGRLTATDHMTQALLTSDFQLGLANERHWHEIRGEGERGWVCYSRHLSPGAWPGSVGTALLTRATAPAGSALCLGFWFLWALVIPSLSLNPSGLQVAMAFFSWVCWFPYLPIALRKAFYLALLG